MANKIRALIIACLIAFVIGNNEDKIVEKLIQRGDDLLSLTNRMLKEYRNHSKQHLLNTIEEELLITEALVIDLQNYKYENPHKTNQLHHLHKLEEELLYHENRISEELEIMVEMFYHENSNKTVDELINHGIEIIELATREVQVKPNRYSSKDKQAIKKEIFFIEKLVEEMKANPNKDIVEKEEALARHEISVTRLLERQI